MVIDPISILAFGIVSALLIWNIKRIDDVRKEITGMHTNDLRHVQMDISDIHTDISNIDLTLQIIIDKLGYKE